MATKRQDISDDLTELVRTLLITQLGLAGVPQQSIRAIAQCDMNRVTGVMKYLRVKSEVKLKKGAC